jgi:TetR/AcrR family transcriptional regulator
MKSIAGAAGVTQSLLHHHFGVKEDLWTAVRERGFKAVLVAMRPLISSAVKDPEFPVVLFESYFDTLLEHPDYVRLLGWNYVLEPGGGRGAPGQAAPLLEILKRLQDAGKINKKIPPPVILSLVWSLAEGWFLGRGDYQRRMGHPVGDEEQREQYRKGAVHTLRVTLYGGVEVR